MLIDSLIKQILQWGLEEAEFCWVMESNTLSRGSLEKAVQKLDKTYRMYDYDPELPYVECPGANRRTAWACAARVESPFESRLALRTKRAISQAIGQHLHGFGDLLFGVVGRDEESQPAPRFPEPQGRGLGPPDPRRPEQLVREIECVAAELPTMIGTIGRVLAGASIHLTIGGQFEKQFGIVAQSSHAVRFLANATNGRHRGRGIGWRRRRGEDH